MVKIQPQFGQNPVKIHHKSVQISSKLCLINMKFRSEFNHISIKIHKSSAEFHPKFIQNRYNIRQNFIYNSSKIYHKSVQNRVKIRPKFSQNPLKFLLKILKMFIINDNSKRHLTSERPLLDTFPLLA